MTPRSVGSKKSSASLKKFGEKVGELRRIKNWSQAQFAEKMKTYSSHVNAIEHGRQNVTFETIEEIAQALGVSIKELF